MNELQAPYVYKQVGTLMNDAALNVACDECSAPVKETCRLKNPQQEGYPVVHHTSRHNKAISMGYTNSITPDHAQMEKDLIDKAAPRMIKRILKRFGLDQGGVK